MARSATIVPAALGTVIRPRLGRDALLMRLLMAVIGLYLVITLVLPLLRHALEELPGP